MQRFPVSILFLASLLSIGCAGAEECREIQRKAFALREEFAACSGGDRCVVVDLGSVVENACLGAFQCFAAFAEGSDLEEFSRRAQELERQFSACRECATADCPRREALTAYCDGAERRCKLRAGDEPRP